MKLDLRGLFRKICNSRRVEDMTKPLKIKQTKNKTIHFQDRPKICLIDTSEDVYQNLIAAGFNCEVGSLGSIIKLPISKPRNKCYCSGMYQIPSNIHEFDILIIDLNKPDPIGYNEDYHQRIEGINPEVIQFLCEYPQTIFDQRPFSSEIVSSKFSEFLERESIIILFASKKYECSYQPVTIRGNAIKYENDFKLDNYSFLSNNPFLENKFGYEISVVVEDEELGSLLSKYDDQFNYQVVFTHPEKRTKNGYIDDPTFFPLMTNGSNDIVSYAYFIDNSIVLVFPQLVEKSSFIIDLLQTTLPSIKPSLFPFNTKFTWINNNEYRLPNENELLDSKNKITQEYERKIFENNQKIKANKEEYQFLHDLLIGSGKKLVKAVEKYLVWLEYPEVINCDEANPDLREEDLQIVLDNGLLVIEVKGISGTSKDSECSQINKIKHRREKERDAFDVYGLYIVNHQRYQPPTIRDNPPFNQTQIDDALSDERGLLTTHDLFRTYFLIDDGLLSKKDAREALTEIGVIKFVPSNAVFLGSPEEIYYDNSVGIFNLNDIKIVVGDKVIFCDDYSWRRTEILSIHVDDEDRTEASNGVVGIRFNDKLHDNSGIYLLKQNND